MYTLKFYQKTFIYKKIYMRNYFLKYKNFFDYFIEW